MADSVNSFVQRNAIIKIVTIPSISKSTFYLSDSNFLKCGVYGKMLCIDFLICPRNIKVKGHTKSELR